MKMAYIISAYKNPEQLVRLVRRLNDGPVSFWIHVDRRTRAELFRRMNDGLSALDNVHFLPRHRCPWGGFGHVAATLEGIDAICRTDPEAEYVILLTGQDYPLKPPERIRDYFAAHAGAAFLEYFPLPHADWQNGGLDRIRAWHIRALGRHLRFPPADSWPIARALPAGMTPYGGSSYWCLPRECVDYVHVLTQRNRDLVRFFRTVDVPDEIFFQTLLLNSPLRDTVVNDNLRFIEWKDLSSGSPSVLTTADFDALLESPKLFARKFDVALDARVLDLVDEHLLSHVGATKGPGQ